MILGVLGLTPEIVDACHPSNEQSTDRAAVAGPDGLGTIGGQHRPIVQMTGSCTHHAQWRIPGAASAVRLRGLPSQIAHHVSGKECGQSAECLGHRLGCHA